MGRIKRKILENIEVVDFAAEGRCFARIKGEVTFLNGAAVAPGDIVKIEVKRKRKGWAEAYILQIQSKSTNRIEPFCTHFGTCGGCKWQHIPYETQLSQKFTQVKDQLERIGKIQLPEFPNIIASPKTQFYRNKLEYTFSNSRWLTREEIQADESFERNALGFHIPGKFDKVLPINKCYLQADPSNAIRDFLDNYAKKHQLKYYDHVIHAGFLRSVMIRTTSTGQVMVVVQFAEDLKQEIHDLLSGLKSTFPQITSLFYFLNFKRNDSFADLNPIYFAGKYYIEEEMEGLKFRIGPKSFYQTNSEQAYELYKVVRRLAEIKSDDIVYDLYTGTGTIANFIARNAQKVVGIEYVEEAIENAKINSQINNISNTSFYAGDMKDILNKEFVEVNGQPDLIITDPPRAGMDKPVTELLLEISPKRIVYVSCNAATQARDLNILDAKYQVVAVQPVDMFPHTHHVENIVSLILRD